MWVNYGGPWVMLSFSKQFILWFDIVKQPFHAFNAHFFLMFCLKIFENFFITNHIAKHIIIFCFLKNKNKSIKIAISTKCRRCNTKSSSGCPLWNKEEKNVEKTDGSPPTLYLLNETKIKWKIIVGWWHNSLFS
jgi:hypothetical protein